jgi:cell division protein FtsW (lipid II flippase)
MGVTYTSTVDRQIGSASVITAGRLPLRQLLLPLTTLVAMLAIALAYGGRTRTTAREFVPGSAKLTNLNAIGDARDLEPPLAAVFANVSDRRFAARALFDHLASIRRDGSVSNVGAVATAIVTADAIERTPGLTRYPERLAAARERAARAGTPASTTLSVLSADEVAALKPSFIVRTPDAFRGMTLRVAALYLGSFYLVILLWKLLGVRGDGPLLAAAHLLTAVGFAVVLARPDPLRDVMIVVRYMQGVLVGLCAMVIVSLVDFRKAAFLKFCYVPLVVALLLSITLMLFGHGPGRSTAKVNLGPVQPSEAIRLLLALFLAGYFARRWELLRQIPSNTIGRYQVPRRLHLPRADYVLPILFGVGASLVLFFLQKDLGPALLLSFGFLAMYAVATARPGMALMGCALLSAGFYIGYRLHISTTLANRVAMWQSPWDNAVQGGDQIAQSIWALSTGGFFGTGLGFGDTRYVPAGHTDLALVAVGEELGAVGFLAIALVYAVLTLRGLRVALRASNDYGFFLATAVTLFLIVPALVMAAGMLGVTPLTGVVTPFLSYGGSAMVANFAALGMLMSIQANTGSTESSKPFRTSTRYLGGALAVTAIGLLALALDIQVVHADDYVVKPHLSMQADGVRRYQYNQRVLDVARLIPRGTIYDRRGFPLATTDTTVVGKAGEQLGELGAEGHPTCMEPIERCYPLGGAAFHVLGDLTTRANWGASNTSYLERDADARLRGFDDHATIVSSTDASGRPVTILQRDYRELVPLLRHRHDRDHPAVKRLLTRKRDLDTTLDARLQHRVATILADHAQRSAGGKAAAVVLDVDTGQLLAAASYPWPETGVLVAQPFRAANRDDAVEHGGDALLDRARYGLYPPGSTFKLVTAAAALRLGDAWSRRTFMCSRLPDGRVGAQIPGWTRPVRDDVLAKHAHGTIDMHDGIVHSCNAYFAQLAVRLGPGPILETASRLGISIAPSHSVQGVRGTLPQAGYGQGDVVATPIRMARVAAAIASGGVLREARLEPRAPASAETEFLLPPDAAARLARYMRDAVVNGSGRRLKDHPWRIAGKTGTGEVSGRPSHAWFVGFAPQGSAGRKIAFAVIIENAGYGGLAAAPVAGEIVSAAAAAGLIVRQP